MKIDKSTIQKLAHLARIEVNPALEDDLIKDMEQIVSWVAKLEELDTSGIEPVTHMSSETNSFRKDKGKNELTKEQALKNAPGANDGFFSVPKVLDK
jgi:aspartyl-tRNA(Asn)/glutamyl-tRNA(Gln) amidotransferase subunit C